ncbi:MAG: very short patch repair endonuclease [Candidatus Moranbacteria bacterium]|nr:very short patch repair endonuclease [Candidatus Moranbacteria bacterium]
MRKTPKNKNYLGRNFRRANSGDKLSKERRSALMSKIRSKNTKLETNFIKLLRKNIQRYFTTHQRTIKGNPDIVFKKRRICVFVDSDFWHGWQFPRWKSTLKNDFWREKIENNRNRDRKTTRYLRKNGWVVIRIWEHSIRENPSVAIQKIKQALKDL